MHCKHGLSERQKFSKWPCGVCYKGVGSNSILCSKCHCYIHKRCSGIKGRLKEDLNYICPACLNPVAVPPPTDFAIDGSNLEVVQTFCYLGDMIGNNGGCFDAITSRVKSAWKKFRELLPILTNKSIPVKCRGRVFSSAVRGVMLHASTTWAVTVDDCNRLIRNDNAMIRWICSTRLSERVFMAVLRNRLGIPPIDDLLRQGRLRWFGHVQRMNEDCWQKRILSHVIDGKYSGRPKKRWMDNIKDDLKFVNATVDMTNDRVAWRTILRGRRPTPASGNNGR